MRNSPMNPFSRAIRARKKYRHLQPQERGALHQSRNIDTAQAAPLLEQPDKVEQRAAVMP